jgi:hypothetical protein
LRTVGTEHKHSSNIGVAARDQIAPHARVASSSKTGPVGAVALDAAKKSIMSIIRVQPITKDRLAIFDRRYGRTTRGLVGTMSR